MAASYSRQPINGSVSNLFIYYHVLVASKDNVESYGSLTLSSYRRNQRLRSYVNIVCFETSGRSTLSSLLV